MPLYRRVELKEGHLVQYVGVYILRWNRAWGDPQVGFVEVDDDPQEAIRAGLQSAEQTLRILGMGFLAGDAATIALDEASNLAHILETAYPQEGR